MKTIYPRVVAILAASVMVFVFSGASYVDVSETDWYYDAVTHSSELGIVKGDEGGFRPNDNVTRAEAVVVLTRVLPDAYWPDYGLVNVDGTWYSDAVNNIGLALGGCYEDVS